LVVVLEKPRLIFIEEPRTASRSTHEWLARQKLGVSPWDYTPGKGSLEGKFDRHMGFQDFKAMLSQGGCPNVNWLRQRIEQFKAFAFARNPFETLATYYQKARNGWLPRPRRDWEIELARSTNGLAAFLRAVEDRAPGYLGDGSHMRRMAGCERVLRFERGVKEELFRFLGEHGVALSNAQRKAFPHKGKTAKKKQDWRKYYDDAAREHTARIYAEYLRLYNYSFEEK
jgi:hypothetical protein